MLSTFRQASSIISTGNRETPASSYASWCKFAAFEKDCEMCWLNIDEYDAGDPFCLVWFHIFTLYCLRSVRCRTFCRSEKRAPCTHFGHCSRSAPSCCPTDWSGCQRRKPQQQLARRTMIRVTETTKEILFIRAFRMHVRIRHWSHSYPEKESPICAVNAQKVFIVMRSHHEIQWVMYTWMWSNVYIVGKSMSNSFWYRYIVMFNYMRISCWYILATLVSSSTCDKLQVLEWSFSAKNHKPSSSRLQSSSVQ